MTENNPNIKTEPVIPNSNEPDNQWKISNEFQETIVLSSSSETEKQNGKNHKQQHKHKPYRKRSRKLAKDMELINQKQLFNIIVKDRRARQSTKTVQEEMETWVNKAKMKEAKQMRILERKAKKLKKSELRKEVRINRNVSGGVPKERWLDISQKMVDKEGEDQGNEIIEIKDEGKTRIRREPKKELRNKRKSEKKAYNLRKRKAKIRNVNNKPEEVEQRENAFQEWETIQRYNQKNHSQCPSTEYDENDLLIVSSQQNQSDHSPNNNNSLNNNNGLNNNNNSVNNTKSNSNLHSQSYQYSTTKTEWSIINCSNALHRNEQQNFSSQSGNLCMLPLKICHKFRFSNHPRHSRIPFETKKTNRGEIDQKETIYPNTYYQDLRNIIPNNNLCFPHQYLPSWPFGSNVVYNQFPQTNQETQNMNCVIPQMFNPLLSNFNNFQYRNLQGYPPMVNPANMIIPFNQGEPPKKEGFNNIIENQNQKLESARDINSV